MINEGEKKKMLMPPTATARDKSKPEPRKGGRKEGWEEGRQRPCLSSPFRTLCTFGHLKSHTDARKLAPKHTHTHSRDFGAEKQREDRSAAPSGAAFLILFSRDNNDACE